MLRPAEGSGKDIYRKNLIREKIRTFFKNRDCHCMVRPLADESRLARIEDENFENLRAGFKFFSKFIFFNYILIIFF